MAQDLQNAANWSGNQADKIIDAGKGLIDKVFNSGESNAKEEGNTNPYAGPVSEPVIVVDPEGNAIPVEKGQQIETSPDSKWVNVKDSEGKPTGTRIDAGHKPGPKHPDPRSHEEHAHVKGKTNPDGTPWLPIRK